MLGQIWDDLLTSANITDIAARLAKWGMEELPDLAVFFADDNQVHCLLRGQVGVVDADSGELLASGVGAKTWFETQLDSRRLYIAVQEVDAANLMQLPLVIGAAQVSSIFFDAMDVEVRFNVAPSVALPTLAEEAAAGAAAKAEAEAAASAQDAPAPIVVAGAAAAPDDEPAVVVEGNQVASVEAASMWGDASGDVEPEHPVVEPAPVVEGNEVASVEAASMWGDASAAVEPEQPVAEPTELVAPEQPGIAPEQVLQSDQPVVEPAPVVEGNEVASVEAASMWGDASAAVEPEQPVAEPTELVAAEQPVAEPEEVVEPESFQEPAAEPDPQPSEAPRPEPDHQEPTAEPAHAAPSEDLARQSIAQPKVDDQHSESPAETDAGNWQTPAAPEPTQVLGDRPPYAEGQHPSEQPTEQSATPGFEQVHTQPVAPLPQTRRSGGWQGTIRPRQDAPAPQQPSAPQAAAEYESPYAPNPYTDAAESTAQAQGDQLIAGVPDSFRVSAPTPNQQQDWRQERPRLRPADIAQDHDGETVFTTGIAQTHKPAEGSRSDDSLVLAAMCAYGHPNQPGAPQCRICGSNVDSHNPQLTSAPVLAVIQTSDGERYELTRPMIIGRAPARGERDGDVQLIKVMSPNQDVSRNHLRIAAKGWQIEISDLNSTNGTLVTRPGSEPVELSGASMPVELGTTIDLGDGQIVTLTSPTGNQ